MWRDLGRRRGDGGAYCQGEGDVVVSLSPVYKVKLVEMEQTSSHDNYIMTILSVIKMGTSTPGPRGQSHPKGHGRGHLGQGTPKWLGHSGAHVGWCHPRVLGDTCEGWWHSCGVGTPKGAGDSWGHPWLVTGLGPPTADELGDATWGR